MRHLLSGPWGLPGDADRKLERYLEVGDYGSAVSLLRDFVPHRTADARLLVILAHARFRDAMETMTDERLAASQEALRLIDAAVGSGFPPADVAPFRQEVERVLADETRAELLTLSRLPEGDDFSQVPLDTAVDAAFRLWDSEPARAAALFDEAHRREPLFSHAVRAALCRYQAKDAERARPVLEEATAYDWRSAGLWADRHMSEHAFAALLDEASRRGDRARFDELWRRAVRRGRQLSQPFPSIWPIQERLLDTAMRLGAYEHAVAVCQHIEDSREHIGEGLAERIRRVRELAAH